MSIYLSIYLYIYIERERDIHIFSGHGPETGMLADTVSYE